MAKKKKETKNLPMLSHQEMVEIQSDFAVTLDTDPKFSLEVDPENKYNMPFEQKEFIKHYVNFKSIPTAAEFAHIDTETALAYFSSYSAQQEIRRINMALCQRRFQQKLLSLDEIGGYLTTFLTDDGVPLADRLKPADKLKVVDMLINLNQMKSAGLQDPSTLMSSNIEVEISKLSVKTISSLLSQSSQSDYSDKRKKMIDVVDNVDGLNPEEKAYLETLPPNELLSLLEEANKVKGNLK